MDNDSDVLREEYRIRFAKKERYRNEVWRILCNEYFRKFVFPDAHVLDLGSGWGEFINNIEAAKKYAMDLNPDAGIMASKEIRFLHQDCAEAWDIPTESLDIVFTSNFLEHLHDKSRVERAISEAYRCLRKGGLLICLGPNVKYIPGAYWDFWDHYIPITEQSIAELLRLKGFDIHLNVPRFLPYSMSSGRDSPLILVKLYLKLPIFWRFFGKQFLVIGKKITSAEQDGALGDDFSAPRSRE